MLAAAATVAAVVAGCGVPYSSEFDPIASDQVPFDLQESTTTSTTTTTTTTPETTVIESTTTALVTTTEVTVQVDLVFVTGSALTVVPAQIIGSATPQQVMSVLVARSKELSPTEGLRSVFPLDVDPPNVTLSNGVAEVDLTSDVFEDGKIPRQDEKLFYGQIVLTLTGLRGVGQVLFLVDGKPARVRTGDNNVTQPGEVVAYQDYDQLLDTTPVTTTTTTTSTTTTTTTTTTLPATTPETTAVP